MRTIVPYQPCLLPPLFYLKRVLDSEVYLVLDHVTTSRDPKLYGRTRFSLMRSGEYSRVSVPFKKSRDTEIKDLKLSPEYSNWVKGFATTVSQLYSKSRNWESISRTVEIFSRMSSGKLYFEEDGPFSITLHLLELLGWEGEVVYSSSYRNAIGEKKNNEMIIECAEILNCDEVVLGATGFNAYGESATDLYNSRDIKLSFQDWDPPSNLNDCHLSTLEVISRFSDQDFRSALGA